MVTRDLNPDSRFCRGKLGSPHFTDEETEAGGREETLSGSQESRSLTKYSHQCRYHAQDLGNGGSRRLGGGVVCGREDRGRGRGMRSRGPRAEGPACAGGTRGFPKVLVQGSNLGAACPSLARVWPFLSPEGKSPPRAASPEATHHPRPVWQDARVPGECPQTTFSLPAPAQPQVSTHEPAKIGSERPNPHRGHGREWVGRRGSRRRRRGLTCVSASSVSWSGLKPIWTFFGRWRKHLQNLKSGRRHMRQDGGRARRRPGT